VIVAGDGSADLPLMEGRSGQRAASRDDGEAAPARYDLPATTFDVLVLGGGTAGLVTASGCARPRAGEVAGDA